MASRQGGKTVSKRDRSDDEDDRKATNVYDRGGIKWARFQVNGREFEEAYRQAMKRLRGKEPARGSR